MAEYRIYCTQSASAGATVEAESLDQAIDAVLDLLPHEVCAQCGGWGRDYFLELDGEWRVDEEAIRADYPNEAGGTA